MYPARPLLSEKANNSSSGQLTLTTGSGTISVTVPSGIKKGLKAVVSFLIDFDDAVDTRLAGAITPPTKDFSFVRSDSFVVDGTWHHMQTWYRDCDGTESGSWTWAISLLGGGAGSNRVLWSCGLFAQCEPGPPEVIDAVAGTASSYSQSHTGVTTKNNKAILVGAWACRRNGTDTTAAPTAPSGMTNVEHVQHSTLGTGTLSLTMAQGPTSTFGASGTKTATYSGGAEDTQSHIHLMALTPKRERTRPFIAASSEANQTTAVTSITCNKPSSNSLHGTVLRGDLLYAVLMRNDGGSGFGTITQPSGWTQIGSTQTFNYDSEDHQVTLWAKDATDSEGSTYQWSFSTSTRCTVQIYAIRGAAPKASQPDASGWVLGTATDEDQIHTGVTTTQTNCLLTCAWNFRRLGTTSPGRGVTSGGTPDANMISGGWNATGGELTNNTGGTGCHGTLFGYKHLGASGATGNIFISWDAVTDLQAGMYAVAFGPAGAEY